MIVYFSQMFQAVQALAQVYEKTGGVFVSSRASTLATVGKTYPEIQRKRFSKRFPRFFPGNAAMRDAEVIVTGSPYGRLLRPFSAKKCMVFHGTYMFLTPEAIEKNAHFDLLCVTGPRMQSMISRHPDITLNCVHTGYLPFAEYPDCDDLLREQKHLALGLEPQKKTILYTPSRKSIGSLGLLAEELIQETPKHYNLIIRPHPSQSLNARIGDSLDFFKLNRLCRSRGNTLLDRAGNKLSDLLSVVDLIISDANSPAEESLFYDLPQLFIETDLHSREKVFELGNKCGIHKDDLEGIMRLYSCGETFFAGDDKLGDAIERSIGDECVYSNARKEYFEWVFGSRDRMAPERVASAIRSLL